jgi:hypothetical protein
MFVIIIYSSMLNKNEELINKSTVQNGKKVHWFFLTFIQVFDIIIYNADGCQTPPHQIVSNTYIPEISINENILMMSSKSLASLDESKVFKVKF